jgi:hypothetical protein
MKFLCSNCRAKYQIADEKVVGRMLRMTCRTCQHEIVIRGEDGAPQGAGGQFSLMPGPGIAAPPPRPSRLPSPPSPLGVDFQQRLAASAPIYAPSAAPLDEWHVAVNDSPVGPHTRDEIARMLLAGTVNAQSLAWREGLDDWLPIRSIAELAAYVLPAPARGSVTPAPFVQPAQRSEVAPVGGRAGPAQIYTLEDWGGVAEPSTANSQIALNPLLGAAAQERRAPSLPSWPAMFALAGGFAFLMSALTILGARWLQNERPQAPVAAAVPAAAVPPPAPPPPLQQQAQVEPENTDYKVIELEDPGMPPEQAAEGRPRAAASRASAPKAGAKNLSAAQREMLARMGGDPGSDIAGLATPKAGGPSKAQHLEGGLTAAQLSQVVLRGRKNLQRCYETALRGAGSTETIRLDVSVTVSPSGNVTDAKAAGQGLPGMSECIERTVRMWRFPDAGESTQTKFPVVFQPGG